MGCGCDVIVIYAFLEHQRKWRINRTCRCTTVFQSVAGFMKVGPRGIWFCIGEYRIAWICDSCK